VDAITRKASHAADVLDRRAQRAAIEVVEVGTLTMREGNPGDDAINARQVNVPPEHCLMHVNLCQG
jgi:hypothetical protein